MYLLYFSIEQYYDVITTLFHHSAGYLTKPLPSFGLFDV